ncbi:MAG: pyridoxal-phosphate dependent enzyme [Lysobacterales bacterium]
MTEIISIDRVKQTAQLLDPFVNRTPVTPWIGPELARRFPKNTQVSAKLELFQHAGTFKARGALSNILRLNRGQRGNGVTAMSAGNHAVAVAYAAKVAGVDAKVVMQKTANPARVELAKGFGAEILMAEDGPTGFALAEKISADEGRAFIHPFDGLDTALGTATLGLEMHQQLGELDVLIVAIGGGGLAGGVSAITRLLNPHCHIIGVEPEGADSMHRSFASGQPENIGIPKTIADSLAPPMTLDLPYSLCRQNINELISVSDAELIDAMGLIFRDMKLAVEPACAAATAALLKVVYDHPGKHIGLVFCGSNIDWASFASIAGKGEDYATTHFA